jgi:hypothetical protein
MRRDDRDNETRDEGHNLHADEAIQPVPSVPQPELPGDEAEDDVPKGAYVIVPPSGQPPLQGEGLSGTADKAVEQVPSALHPHGGEEGQASGAREGHPTRADLAATVAAIRYHHRTRRYAMAQRKRADLSLGAFLRLALGWRKDAPAEERKRVADQARALIAAGEAETKKGDADTDEPAYAEWRHVILASIAARKPFDDVEKAATKAMERLAATLPVWQWAEPIKGFSARGLATIVGEAGDLGTYPKKGHLWKRMGLAVIGAGDGVNDVRQGNAGRNASKEDWIAHGYNAERRAMMFVIGDTLVKTNKPENPYRAVYDRRKAQERAKAEAKGLTIVPAAKIPQRKPDGYVAEGTIHLRAQRYMEKRLLRDIWQAWRAAA